MLLGTIPYDGDFTQAQIQRETLLEYADGKTSRAVRSIFERIMEGIGMRARQDAS